MRERRDRRTHRSCLVSAVAAAALLAQTPAHAQCLPDPASVGDDVVCTGVDTDGFQADVLFLEVLVESDAEVDNEDVDGVSAIRVIDKNDDVTNLGTITAAGTASHGIEAGDDNPVIVNEGSIDVTGTDAHGISVDDRNTVTNTATGTITVSGPGGHGIALGQESSALNDVDATIVVQGAGSDGISGGEDAILRNRGDIELSGGGNTGLSAGATANLRSFSGASILANDADSTGMAAIDGTLRNDGRIDLLGDGSTGMILTGAPTDTNMLIVTNTGDIFLVGEDGIGMEAGDESGLSNTGRIGGDSMIDAGAGATGMLAGDVGSMNNSGQIELQGANSRALVGGDSAILMNSGEVTLSGDDSRGLVAGNSSMLLHTGERDPMTLSGGLTLSGDTSTAFTTGHDAVVDSHGFVEVTGAAGVGVQSGDRSVIANFGSLTVSGDDGVGIRVGSAGTVSNSGPLLVEGMNGVGVVFQSTGTDGSTLTNFGTIAGGTGTGLAVDFAGSGTGLRTLSNEFGATIRSASGLAIRVGDRHTSITNAGTIEGMVLLGAANDEVVNLGSVIGDVMLQGGDDVLRLRNLGVIAGTAFGGAGTDSLLLEGSGGSLILDSVSEFESLSIEPAASWTLSGAGAFPNGIVANDGSTVMADGTADLTGDYLQGSGSTFQVELFFDGSSSLLDIDGAADIGAQTTLTVVSNEPIAEDVPYTVLSATGGLTGVFENVGFPPESAVLSFSTIYSPMDLVLLFSRSSYASVADTLNERATGAYLDDVLDLDPTGDLAELFANLDMLSAEELQTALDGLHPEIYDAQTSVMLALGRAFTQILRDRPQRCGSLRPPTGQLRSIDPCSGNGFAPWVVPIGSLGRRNGRTGHVSYDFIGAGAALGVDWQIDENWLLSGQLGAARTGLDLGDAGGTGTLTDLEFALSAARQLGPVRLLAMVSYGHGWHETRRDLESPLPEVRATADHQSNRLTGLIEASYPYDRWGISIEPLLSLEYTYLREQALTESGIGAMSLDVATRSNSLFSSELGVRVSGALFKHRYVYSWLEWADGVWTPEFSARWRETWTGWERDLTSRMTGGTPAAGSFTVVAQDARRGALLGTRLTFQPLHTRTTIGVGYEVFWGDHSLVHTLDFKVEVPF